MNHIEKLQNYLIDNDKGYLVQDISKGKVIMLSGKWGSGKTHFWQNKIQTVLKENTNKIPNHYISLYGKTTIEEIRNEVFLKIFESMDIFEIGDKSFALAKNTANLVADLTKTVSVFGLNLDLSKIVDKSFEKLEKVREEGKEEKTKALLNSGAIICFDDFERKSKDIDLNDLFGFITQLALNFSCKVVIILNDDVFKGEGRKIFTNVKEKSVSKYISFSPNCKDLFNLIFDSDEEKKEENQPALNEYKAVLQKSFEEINIVNARIMIQTLDNLREWIKNENSKDDETLRLFVLININFILNHQVFIANTKSRDKNEFKNSIETFKSINTNSQPMQYPKEMEKYVECRVKDNNEIPSNIEKEINKHITNYLYDENIIENLKYKIELEGKENLTKSGKADYSQILLSYIENNSFYIKSTHFMDYFKINQYCQKDENKVAVFNKINDFIKTGVL
ncbi:MAG: P-loop NTPase fold protein [Sulfurimonas sp.]|jgi:hypothetical protein|uniref:P-loop NTPase fold protein n=1 Tax=Sulfurimonas sp. TaxID=2022749 RepID=UPI003564C31D